MAFDDPVVWVLIVAVVIFLFGANKIPQIAKGIGQARREFEAASKGLTDPMSSTPTTNTVAPTYQPASTPAPATEDPLITAAKKEGIETQGKTKEQIASELAWKLKKSGN